MNILIVSTWFERGASYVSKSYYETFSSDSSNNIYIYARGGEKFEKNNKNWDLPYVFWNQDRLFDLSPTPINLKQFSTLVNRLKIDLILFNEQQDFTSILRIKKSNPNIKLGAYIDYYKKETVRLFEIYDFVICNTERHFSVFKDHSNPIYIPWGTDVKEKTVNVVPEKYLFISSVGMNWYRKGLDLLLDGFLGIEKYLLKKSNIELNIFTQKKLPFEITKKINHLSDVISIVTKVGDFTQEEVYKEASIYCYLSRLDGIGLSLPESIANGCVGFINFEDPMKQFIDVDNSFYVKPSKYKTRKDLYYWDESEPSINDISDKIKEIINTPLPIIRQMSNNNIKFAQKKLNWTQNSSDLNYLISKINTQPVNKITENLIIQNHKLTKNKLSIKDKIYRIYKNFTR